VSDHTVARVRAELASEGGQQSRDTTNNGQSGGGSARRAQRRTSNNQTSATSEIRTDRAGRQQPARKGKKRQAKACQRCFRIGAPTCRPCRKKWPKGFPAEWQRQPGDDGEDLRRGKNGQAKHDFEATENLLGKLTRSFEGCANAYGRSAAYQATDAAVKTLTEAWHAWKKECCHA
jgi:hypothetical protein